MTITVRLDPETEKKLNYLLKDINKEPKGYADQTVSDIVRLAINNEWVNVNLQHVDDYEIDDLDSDWKEKYYCTENST